MQKWAESELQQADLGDARRNKRLVRIVEDLAAQPASSVPQACGDIAAKVQRMIFGIHHATFVFKVKIQDQPLLLTVIKIAHSKDY